VGVAPRRAAVLETARLRDAWRLRRALPPTGSGGPAVHGPRWRPPPRRGRAPCVPRRRPVTPGALGAAPRDGARAAQPRVAVRTARVPAAPRSPAAAPCRAGRQRRGQARGGALAGAAGRGAGGAAWAFLLGLPPRTPNRRLPSARTASRTTAAPAGPAPRTHRAGGLRRGDPFWRSLYVEMTLSRREGGGGYEGQTSPRARLRVLCLVGKGEVFAHAPTRPRPARQRRA